MSRSHNKKRNVGLVYEFLVRYISRALVENRQDSASDAVAILNRHFKVDSELYKEFRLFNSLLTTTVSSTNVVSSIISEARLGAKRCDIKKLDSEKSMLIREINHALKDPTFFNQSIDNYKVYATIQTLLNDWRTGGDVNIAKMASYEDTLSQWILCEKAPLPDIESHKDTDVNDILVNVMIERIEQKYSSILTEGQQELIRAYAISSHHGENSEIVKMMESIRNETRRSIDNFLYVGDPDETLIQKLQSAASIIDTPGITEINDENMENHLKFIKLSEELQS